MDEPRRVYAQVDNLYAGHKTKFQTKCNIFSEVKLCPRWAYIMV